MIEAIDTWVERKFLERLKARPFFLILADECQDVSTQEDLSIYFHWIVNGCPEEHFMTILHVKSTCADTITKAITSYLRTSKARYIFNYSKADIDGLVSHMADVNLNHCLSLLDADQIWLEIKREICEACQVFVPQVRILPSSQPRWFNAEIRHLINRTRSLRRRIKYNPTNHLVSKLYHLESSLDQLILHAKLQYEQY